MAAFSSIPVDREFEPWLSSSDLLADMERDWGPSNPRPAARVSRRSLVLRHRIEARPMRQPFLEYVSNDDFVAALIRYDTVRSLDKVRFCARLRFGRVYENLRYRRRIFDNQTLLLQLMFELLNLSRISHKVHYLSHILTTDPRFAPCVLELASLCHFIGLASYTCVDGANYYEWSVEKDAFMKDMRSISGMKYVQLPSFGPVTDPPMWMTHTEDLEGMLRATAVLFSIVEITKPSAWMRRFPWTVKPNWFQWRGIPPYSDDNISRAGDFSFQTNGNGVTIVPKALGGPPRTTRHRNLDRLFGNLESL